MAFIPIAKYTFLVGAALVGSVFAREACTSNDFGFSGDSCKGSKCREKTEDSKEGSMLEPQESGLGFHSSSPPPPTVETLVEDFQNLGLEDNNDDNDNDYNNDNSDNEDNENENENVSWDSLGKEENDRDPQYPQRPNCSYYLRTGKCRYGLNCRYNHPARRQNQARRSVSQEAAQVKKKAKEKEKLSERAGQQECKYYHHTGGCKFGKACRYKHPREKIMVPPPDNFNFLDLPIRPGEKECSCYMRTGSCKYGTNCRFHHPEPSPVGEDLPPEYNSGSVSLHSSGISQQASASSWSSPTTLNETVAYSDASSHVPMMFPPPHGVNPNLELNGYQPPAYPTERSTHPPPSFAMNSSTNRTDFSASYQQLVLEEFLERPGQAGCSYFMKNEDCRFRSASKHHHSKNSPACALSPMGLPLKPDQNICTHYSRHGFCKFGPACKYNHPVNYASSASSSVPTPSQLPSFGNFANCGWE